MFGKMSVGVLRIITGLRSRISSASTMNVYGRSSATLIIHMSQIPSSDVIGGEGLNSSVSRGPREPALAHFADQRSPFHAQACRGAPRTAHHPIAFAQGMEDMIALGVFQGVG